MRLLEDLNRSSVIGLKRPSVEPIHRRSHIKLYQSDSKIITEEYTPWTKINLFKNTDIRNLNLSITEFQLPEPAQKFRISKMGLKKGYNTFNERVKGFGDNCNQNFVPSWDWPLKLEGKKLTRTKTSKIFPVLQETKCTDNIKFENFGFSEKFENYETVGSTQDSKQSETLSRCSSAESLEHIMLPKLPWKQPKNKSK